MSTYRDIIPELERVTTMIWEPACDGMVVRIEALSSRQADCETKGACVHILGGWNGSVSVECHHELALLVTRRMLEISQEPTEEDWKGTIRELANVTGGNIKGQLGQGCILSTPRAFENSSFKFDIPETAEVICLDFLAANYPLRVRIHESKSPFTDF